MGFKILSLIIPIFLAIWIHRKLIPKLLQKRREKEWIKDIKPGYSTELSDTLVELSIIYLDEKLRDLDITLLDCIYRLNVSSRNVMRLLNARFFLEAYNDTNPSILTWTDRDEEVYDFLTDVIEKARIWEKKI